MLLKVILTSRVSSAPCIGRLKSTRYPLGKSKDLPRCGENHNVFG
jgi:hypothetical protein